jgi:hypothetical protein
VDQETEKYFHRLLSIGVFDVHFYVSAGPSEEGIEKLVRTTEGFLKSL